MPKCLWVLVNFNLNATAALWNQSGPGRQIKWMSILQVEWWKEAKRPCLPLWTADVTAIEWGWMAFVTLSDVVIISVWMALESHLNIVLVVSCRDWPFRELSLCFYYLISFFFLFFLSLLLLLLSFISTRLPPFRKSPIQQWRILTRTRGGSQPSFFFLLLFNIIQTSLAVQLIAASFSLAQGGRRLFAHGSRSWVSNLNFVSSVFDGRFSRQFCQAELNRNE